MAYFLKQSPRTVIGGLLSKGDKFSWQSVGAGLVHTAGALLTGTGRHQRRRHRRQSSTTLHQRVEVERYARGRCGDGHTCHLCHHFAGVERQRSRTWSARLFLHHTTRLLFHMNWHSAHHYLRGI